MSSQEYDDEKEEFEKACKKKVKVEPQEEQEEEKQQAEKRGEKQEAEKREEKQEENVKETKVKVEKKEEEDKQEQPAKGCSEVKKRKHCDTYCNEEGVAVKEGQESDGDDKGEDDDATKRTGRMGAATVVTNHVGAQQERGWGRMEEDGGRVGAGTHRPYLEDEDEDERALLRAVIVAADSEDGRQRCCLSCITFFPEYFSVRFQLHQ